MFCAKCGNELKDNDKFCSKCGSKIAEDITSTPDTQPLNNSLNKSLNSSLNKKFKNPMVIKISTVIAIALILIVVLIFSLSKSNKNPTSSNDSTTTNATSDSSTAPSSENSSSKDNLVGSSKVKSSIKDGRTYYTSSDGKWTTEKNSISYKVGQEEKSQRFSLKNSTFGSFSAWQGKLAHSSDMNIYINMTSEISQDSTYTLKDAKGIKDGYITHIYLEDLSKLDPSMTLYKKYYTSSTIVDSSSETQYHKAFTNLEMKIDCFDSKEGIICAYISFSAPLFDKTSFDFTGYFAVTVPGTTSNSNTTPPSTESSSPSTNFQPPKIEVQPLPKENPKKSCIACHGSKMCSICGGTGTYRNYGQSSPCSACGTTGKCSTCNGTGYN